MNKRENEAGKKGREKKNERMRNRTQPGIKKGRGKEIVKKSKDKKDWKK